MGQICLIFGLVFKATKAAVAICVCLGMVFVAYRGSQPIDVPGAPAGMTYFEFIKDRVEAAKVIEPSRCGWGMFLTLGLIGPTYSVVYTDIGMHPGGFLDRVSAPDSNIPTGVAGASWYEAPGVWWDVVEQISWTTLGKPRARGCRFRLVGIGERIEDGRWFVRFIQSEKRLERKADFLSRVLSVVVRFQFSTQSVRHAPFNCATCAVLCTQ